MSSIEKIWARALDTLRGQMEADPYRRWVLPIVPLRLDEKGVVLGVPNEMYIVFIESNGLFDFIKDAICLAAEQEYGVRFEVVEQKPAETKKLTAESGAPIVSVRRKLTEKAAAVRVAEENEAKLDESGSLVELNRRFTFSSFVVGDCNRIAYAVSNAVAEKPGTQYNPYFIYSGTGMGKTHLLQAIAQEVLRRTPTAKVMYVTSEEMLNQYVDAMSHNQSLAFRKKYRSLDVLLIDDVQFIGTTQKFQEEFFHTFNALYNAHKQIVMTSDKPPQDINGLEKRLVSRFECGFTAEIQAPDLETRIAIIRKKQEDHEYKLDDSVIRYVAEHLHSSIRRLESSVFKLVSWAQISNVKIDIKAVEHILSDVLTEEASSALTVDDIQRVVAEHYDLRVSDITGPRRPANIAFPRQVAMYLSRRLTELSAVSVGEKFQRNHATVVHAEQAIEKKMQESRDFKLEIQQIERKLCKA